MIWNSFARTAVAAANKRTGFRAIPNSFLNPPSMNIFLPVRENNPSLLIVRSTSTELRKGSVFPPKYGLTKSSHIVRFLVARTSSSSSGSGQKSSSSAGKEEEPMSHEIALTPGEKVVVGTRLFFWAGAFAFASVCAYYIGKELIPTKMSPNTVFDKATNSIRENEEVTRRFGAFKTYGRDHGGHREGRRNFIEHTEYVSQDDGSKRTRVRFNLEGPFGQAFVFAEVSSDMPSGEFVYLLVQDKRNGAVITVVDNRSALLAKKMAGESQEGMAILGNLLGGGKK